MPAESGNLDQLRTQLEQLSPERRALVERHLQERGVAVPVRTQRIARRTDSSPAPLTYNQELLWALDQAIPDLVAYNVPRVLQIVGAIDRAALSRALDTLVERHEALRTRFVAGPSGPRQIVGAPEPVRVAVHDLRSTSESERAARVDEIVLAETRHRFDLSRDLLLRVALIQVSDAEWVLLLLTHHIVCDEWSRDVTFRDLGALYEAALRGHASALAPLPLQYADYAAWQRTALDEGAFGESMRFWRAELSSPPVLQLPTDRPRGAAPSFAGNRRRFVLPPDVTERLRTLARGHDVTLHMVLLAAYGVVLSRHSGQTDILVGSPVSTRSMPELEGLIGYFPNALVLRLHMEGDPSFAELLARVRATCLAAYDHPDVPLERLAVELRQHGELGGEPLFTVWFVTGAPEPAQLTLPDATVTLMPTDFHTAKFDLSFSIAERSDRALDVVLEYRTEQFDPGTIDRIFEHYATAIDAVVQNPSLTLSAIPLLSSAESARVLREFNATTREYPADATLASLFADQVERTPAAIAVVDDSHRLTYAELARRARSLAAVLVASGAGRGTRVAVCIDRSVDLLTALVATVMAGAAYVPLDPEYPADRLSYMLSDAGVQAVLTTTDLRSRLAVLDQATAPVIFADGVASPAAEAALLPEVHPDDPAYMIYTSGSTGRPKGALNAHRGIVNRLLWMQDEYRLRAGDMVLQKTPASFDVSVWEFFWPIITGATLVMARPGGHRDARYLIDAIAAHGVTVCHFVPSMLRAFLADPDVGRCTTLRDVIASGEALLPDLVAAFRRALPHARLHNLYGPTECAVDVTAWACPPIEDAPAVVPIGCPVANTQLYILDEHRAPVPIGVAGEIYIGGVQVGLGYHARPELTAERFVANPFAASAGARMYRTGDQGRWRADGTLEYLGRLDQQVKVRGFRIELGEIESTLDDHPGIASAAVAVQQDDFGGSRLVAYVVSASDGSGSIDAVDHWAQVFDSAYARADETADAVESGFNIAGWVSSYNHRPMPAGEMREWVETTCDRILTLEPRRVFEIGCGTGLLLFRIAPRVDCYHGIDISRAALDAIAQDPAFAAIDDRVSLQLARADEINQSAEGEYDVVVINSVAQYFPSAQYLADVLRRAERILAPGGCIFVGDVRLRPLLEIFHTSVVLHESAPETSVADVRARVEQRMWNESELVLDPEFFSALARTFGPAATADVLVKRGQAVNELTKFRADVVIRLKDDRADAPLTLRAESLTEVPSQLMGHPAYVRVTDVRDARLAADVAAHAAVMTAPSEATVSDIRLSTVDTGDAVTPEMVEALGAGYDVTLTWPASQSAGRFDAHFRAPSASASSAPRERSEPPAHGTRWAEYAHAPALETFALAHVDAWRSFLRERLPDYMIPSAFVRVDTLPLTPSGKVDRKALRPPRVVRRSKAPRRPETATEKAMATLWAEILRVGEIGADDGFLDLGGHSLLAVRVVGRVRRDLGVALELEPMLRGATLAEVAARIDELRIKGQSDDDEFDLAPISRDAFSLGPARAGGRA